MRQRLDIAVLYALVGFVIFGIWVVTARTEGWEGEPPPFVNWGSLKDSADGAVAAPFVGRRLLPDAARLVAAAVPEALWVRFRAAISGTRLEWFLAWKLNWHPADWPLLISGFALIYLSVLGFMASCWAIVRAVYAGPKWAAHCCTIALGMALLGSSAGRGDGVYPYDSPMLWNMYPYDLPQAFIFALGLALILRRSVWILALLPVAAYSKETSLLLIVAYLVVPSASSWRWKMARAALMVIAFVAVRSLIAARYPQPPAQDFMLAGRNLVYLTFIGTIYGAWWLPVYAVAALAVARCWSRYPSDLKRLLVLVLIEVGACFFKGWIEERRAYLELLPVVGLLALQTVALEFRVGWLLRDRARTDVAPTVPPALPRTGDEVSELVDRLYPQATGLGGVVLRWRPYIVPLEEVLALVRPGGTLLDVGCGVGLLSALAAATRTVTFAHGFDTSARAIGVARAIDLPEGSGRTLFECLPAGSWPAGEFETVLCVDVLHHVPFAARAAFLANVCECVAVGGRLIFKDIAPDPLWKAWANRLHDLLVARQWVGYTPLDEVVAHCRAAGLTVTESGRWDRLWYGHYFVVAEARPRLAALGAG